MEYFGKENDYSEGDLSNLRGYDEEFLCDNHIKKMCDRLKDAES